MSCVLNCLLRAFSDVTTGTADRLRRNPTNGNGTRASKRNPPYESSLNLKWRESSPRARSAASNRHTPLAASIRRCCLPHNPHFVVHRPSSVLKPHSDRGCCTFLTIMMWFRDPTQNESDGLRRKLRNQPHNEKIRL
jgi:hypothetical protein